MDEYELSAEDRDFVETVYEALMRETGPDRLDSGALNVQVHRGKRYPLPGDDQGVETDFSVEISAGSAPPQCLLAVRCLDSETPLEAAELQAFRDALAQLGDEWVRGLIVTPQALDKEALQHTGPGGVAVVRILPDVQVLWLNAGLSPLTFKAYDRIDAYDFKGALLEPDYVGQNRQFYGIGDAHLFGDWHTLLEYYVRAYLKQHRSKG